MAYGRGKTASLTGFDRVLIHEWAMGMMLVQIMARLVIAGVATGWLAAYLAVAGGYVVLITAGIRTGSPWWNRLRLLWNIIAMNFAFTSIKFIVPALGLEIRDRNLAAIDRFLVGGDLSLAVQRYFSNSLTELMSLGYMLFIVFLFFAFYHYGIRAKLAKLSLFCSGLFTLYGIGITGYTLVPAQGPYVYFANKYTVPVQGYLFTRLNELMVRAGSSGYDVFPSLHVGVGLYLFLFFYFHDRRIWRLYCIPFVLLVISTIYLRYHYFIDLLCGAFLGLFCFILTRWRKT